MGRLHAERTEPSPMVVTGCAVYMSITNKTPAPLCAASFLPSRVVCRDREAVVCGSHSVVFVSVCFLVNVSGRRLVGFNTETNLHRR